MSSPVDQLKQIVDDACSDIRYGGLSRADAEELAHRVRGEALKLVPDMMDTYDLIYEARFRRLIDQFTFPQKSESSSS